MAMDQMTESEVDEEINFKQGTVISSSKQSYVIEVLLGEGGFGAVYKVHDQATKKTYAMKVEKKTEKRKHSKLKMEIAILKLVAEKRTQNTHFTAIIDRGKKEHYFFLVMELVGKSLADLKKQGRVFSIGTGLGVGIQCLEAIEDLSKSGFIHRDIKPANYACGLEDKKRAIYLLDFGIARMIMKNGTELKTPRVIVGFKGTVSFASLACHKKQDMSKKDDCESWFYLLVDLLLEKGLPWRRYSDLKDVQSMKTNVRKPGNSDFELFYEGLTKCRADFMKIIGYIDELKYYEKPDYGYIYAVLKEASQKAGVSIDDPYDWEDAGAQNRRQPKDKS